MAVCLKCHNPMNQTEANCPHCGEDFFEAQPDRWHLLLHTSSLRDLFRLTSVMCVFFALLSMLISLHNLAFWPVGLGFACAGCALLLGEAAPLSSRVFSLVGILAFLVYPLLAMLITIWALILRFVFQM